VSGGLDWQPDVRPVLEAVKRALDQGGHGYVEGSEINDALGRAPNDPATDLALSKLKAEGMIDGYRESEGWSNCTLVGDGLRIVAGWPTRPGDDTYELLLSVLAERAEAALTAEEKSKWLKLREGITSAGRDLVVDVLGSIATQNL
jgi:hypothetical protein